MLRSAHEPAVFPLQKESGLQGKCVVFVLTGGPHRAPAYRQLRECGVHIVMVAPEVNWADCYVDDWILADTCDLASTLHLVTERLPTLPTIHGVLSFDEYGVYPASCLSEHLGCIASPCPPSVVKETNVKSHFRAFCAKNGIHAPKCATIADMPALNTLMDSFPLAFPVIVKPSAGGGSSHIKVVRSEEELRSCCAALFACIHTERQWSAIERVQLLLEEFLEGDEVDIDCVVQNGVIKYAGISDNRPTQLPYFRETGGIAPSQLSDRAKSCLFAELQKWVASHGTAVNGILHYEAKYDLRTDRATTIEVNLRLGGAETLCLNETVWGVSLAVCAAMVAVGNAVPDLTATAQCVVSSVNMIASHPGLLRAVCTPSSLLQDPSFAGACLASPGTKVGPPPFTFTSLGFLCAKAHSTEASEAAVQRLEATVRFTIDRDDVQDPTQEPSEVCVQACALMEVEC